MILYFKDYEYSHVSILFLTYKNAPFDQTLHTYSLFHVSIQENKGIKILWSQVLPAYNVQKLEATSRFNL